MRSCRSKDLERLAIHPSIFPVVRQLPLPFLDLPLPSLDLPLPFHCRSWTIHCLQVLELTDGKPKLLEQSGMLFHEEVRPRLSLTLSLHF